jgi:molybdopterin molybdotransferase
MARARVLGAAAAMPPERVPLADARGRALRRSVRAPHPLPPFANSSMDGLALRAQDVAGATPSSPVELTVIGTVAAGAASARAVGPGEALRIMTGAPIPPGADAVVPFEDTGAAGSGDRVRVNRAVEPGAFVRGEGEDLARDAVALEAGRELSPHDLALLAAIGIAQIDVGRRPRVVIVSTGNELLGVEEPLRPGAIRDSNVPLLRALLEECGCTVLRAERAPDDPAEVAKRVQKALGIADVVFTIGGVSEGDFDPVKQGLDRLPGAELWRVAMKPGRPQAFGVHEGRLFFGLPGNPASVACVFEALVRPALRALQGHAQIDRPRLAVHAAEDIESRAGRTDFVRAVLEPDGDGWRARPAGAQVSGHLTPQSRAHALLIVPEATSRLAAGDRADAWLLRWPEPTA